MEVPDDTLGLEVLLRDPISRERLHNPVLASDGHTYSLDSLKTALASDGLHRSPVTQEVLRREAFVNVVANQLLGATDASLLSGTAVDLWASSDDDDDEDALKNDESSLLFTQTVTLPARLSALLAAAVLEVGIPVVAPSDVLELRVLAAHDGSGGTKTLMHPPPPEQAWDACVKLCHATFGARAFRNPWCIAGATVLVNGTSLGTVEALWSAKVLSYLGNTGPVVTGPDGGHC